MRKALNENPVVQMVVLGVVGVILVVMVFTMLLKGEEEVPVTDPATAVAPATGEVAPVDPAAAPVVPSTPAPAESPADQIPPGADVIAPGKGLPKDLAMAYADKKAIALLVVDPKANADKKLQRSTNGLAARDGVAVFVTDVDEIADYSRITSGVAVDRVPALIVIRPRGLTDNVPTATVSYGFRSPKSVEQALDDALYDGAQVPAYP